MDIENVDLKKIAQQAQEQQQEAEKPENQDDAVLTEEEKERAHKAAQQISEEDKNLMSETEVNRMLLAAYADDPSLAEVTTEIFHSNVQAGPPATKENTARLTAGQPALYPDGRQWYPEGKAPENWLRGTVELEDGTILNPFQAIYIMKKYNTARLTDGALKQLFAKHAEEAISLGFNPLENEANLQRPVTEENASTNEAAGPVLPERPAQMIHETEDGDTVIAAPGGGLVVEVGREQKPGDLPPESMKDVEDYIENMETDFEEAAETRKMMAAVNPGVASADEVAEIHGPEAVKHINNQLATLAGKPDAKVEDIKVDDIAEESADPREETEKRLQRFNEAIVSIDKVNSQNLEFTAEERAKLEYVDKIKVAEVEFVDIQSIRRRKAKTGAVDTLLKRRGNTARSFNMLIPASGYVATMSGCSLHELMNLINEGGDPVQSYLMKWSIIHSKLITTTLGDMPDFNYFMKHTADSDMNAFIYAIMVASLPANDTITLTCNEDACKQADGRGRDYEFPYSVRSLLRVEEFSDELIETLNQISAASTTKEAAMEVHNQSIVMTSKAIRLPDSGDIIEIQAPSAYDFLERTLKVVTGNDEVKPEYGRAAVTSSRVNAVLAMDGDNDPIEITDPLEIIKFIYALPARDIIILERMIETHTSNNSFTFGLVDITCPHCKKHTEVLPIDISELLFIRNAKVTETIVE